MIRNKIILPLALLLIATATFTSCEDFFDVKSDRFTSSEDYNLTTPSDSLFSMFGLFTQLQKLGDSYVLLGELRADLMDITEKSDFSLREINNHSISSENTIVNIRDYYAVINNCNYIMSKLDTSMVEKGLKLKRSQFAAVSAIRAWTYMQLALNFKTVKYYEDPILTVSDAGKVVEEIDFSELANRLIPQLEQIKDIPLPAIGFIESYRASNSMIPVKFVLGDLYLWTGQYESAANAYKGLLYDKSAIIDKNNTSSWDQVNNTISSTGVLNWNKSFVLGGGEVISTITCPTEYGQQFLLDTLNNQRLIKSSDIAINKWKNQVYFLNEASSTTGDLRRFGSLAYNEATNAALTSNYIFSGLKTSDNLIYKYKIYDQNVIICRASLVYLRYAEAVNRLNKPNLAFAVLKSGLNSTNLFLDKIVPAKERTAPLPSYMQFTDIRFQNNVGLRMRALGNADKDTTFYKIPKLPTMLDSVRYVETLIEQEDALETAFEGNRFHDLMRFTLRRMNDGYGDDESYLADKIAQKHADKAAMKAKLMNRENWYIRQ